jgi:hypothetical protein
VSSSKSLQEEKMKQSIKIITANAKIKEQSLYSQAVIGKGGEDGGGESSSQRDFGSVKDEEVNQNLFN